MNRVANSVRDYVSNLPNADYSTITIRFGTPEQIAVAYLEEINSQELAHKLTIKKKILMIVVVTAFVAILLWGAVVFSALVEHQHSDNGFYVEEIANISDGLNLVEGASR